MSVASVKIHIGPLNGCVCNVSQGSVATYTRCDGSFNIHLATNLPRNIPVKFLIGSDMTELWSWVCGSTFLVHPVLMLELGAQKRSSKRIFKFADGPAVNSSLRRPTSLFLPRETRTLVSPLASFRLKPLQLPDCGIWEAIDQEAEQACEQTIRQLRNSRRWLCTDEWHKFYLESARTGPILKYAELLAYFQGVLKCHCQEFSYT